MVFIEMLTSSRKRPAAAQLSPNWYPQMVRVPEIWGWLPPERRARRRASSPRALALCAPRGENMVSSHPSDLSLRPSPPGQHARAASPGQAPPALYNSSDDLVRRMPCGTPAHRTCAWCLPKRRQRAMRTASGPSRSQSWLPVADASASRPPASACCARSWAGRRPCPCCCCGRRGAWALKQIAASSPPELPAVWHCQATASSSTTWKILPLAQAYFILRLRAQHPELRRRGYLLTKAGPGRSAKRSRRPAHDPVHSPARAGRWHATSGQRRGRVWAPQVGKILSGLRPG